MPLLPFIFIIMPLVEIAGFAFVGSLIGVLPTVALVVLTTLLGATLLRIQGFGALSRIRTTVETGGSPGRDVIHGLMIALAGALLVIPGFVTDLFGLFLFIPLVRELVWRFLKNRFVVVDAASYDSRHGFRREGPNNPNIIDLDVDDFSRKNEPPRRPPAIDHES